MSETEGVHVTLEQEGPYAFRVSFEGTPLDALHTDEAAPLGGGTGPGPAMLLLAAIANCLGASLLFALRKFRNEPGAIRIAIAAQRLRNADGRWRLPRAQVSILLAEAAGRLEHFDHVLAQFEQFCIVTQSVREGIAVDVRIVDADGTEWIPGGSAGGASDARAD